MHLKLVETDSLKEDLYDENGANIYKAVDYVLQSLGYVNVESTYNRDMSLEAEKFINAYRKASCVCTELHNAEEEYNRYLRELGSHIFKV